MHTSRGVSLKEHFGEAFSAAAKNISAITCERGVIGELNGIAHFWGLIYFAILACLWLLRNAEIGNIICASDNRHVKRSISIAKRDRKCSFYPERWLNFESLSSGLIWVKRTGSFRCCPSSIANSTHVPLSIHFYTNWKRNSLGSFLFVHSPFFFGLPARIRQK